jgi:alkyldihydroxyacetonephosphate synthase
LLCGGALFHHHGVGKLRKEFLPRIMSGKSLEWQKKFKNAVSPDKILGCGNLAVE